MISNPFSHAISSSILSKSSPLLSPARPAMFLSLSSSSLAPPAFRFAGNLSPSRGDSLRIQCHKLGRAIIAETFIAKHNDDLLKNAVCVKDDEFLRESLKWASSVSCGALLWLGSAHAAYSSTELRANAVYEVGALFELGIQLSYLLLLLILLGVGSFFVIRQVLLRRELDLSAKELQEQVRSGDANATELFELGAVMLRRKFYPAATKYLLQAIDKWDGDEQDVAQVYNALGVSYVRDGKLDKGISQFETAVKIQPGYVTAWNNLGDAYEKKKDMKAALRAFEEVLLFDPNNQVARPRVDSLRARVKMYKGVPVTSKLKGDEY